MEEDGRGSSERLEQARRALYLAEERTGVKDRKIRVLERSLSSVDSVTVGSLSPAPAASSLSATGPQQRLTSVGDSSITIPTYSPRGSVLEVGGDNGALIRSAVSFAARGQWVAFVAVQDVGWLFADECGLDLDRVLYISCPRGIEGKVLGVLLQEIQVICVGKTRIPSSQQRRLGALARRESRTVLTLEPWPGVSKPCGDLSRNTEFSSNEHMVV